MGQFYNNVTVRNVSSADCTLKRTPTLVFSDPQTNAFTALPYTLEVDPGLDEVGLPPGGTASLMFHTTNGYGGFATDAPECQHPARYTGIAVVLADGSYFRLPGFELNLTCGVVTVRRWYSGG